jgi:hypothetical protein
MTRFEEFILIGHRVDANISEKSNDQSISHVAMLPIL